MSNTFALTIHYRARTVWEFPKERFVEYEKSDEPWCRYCGIGREVKVMDSVTIPQAHVSQILSDGSLEIAAVGSDIKSQVIP